MCLGPLSTRLWRTWSIDWCWLTVFDLQHVCRMYQVTLSQVVFSSTNRHQQSPLGKYSLTLATGIRNLRFMLCRLFGAWKVGQTPNTMGDCLEDPPGLFWVFETHIAVTEEWDLGFWCGAIDERSSGQNRILKRLVGLLRLVHQQFLSSPLSLYLVRWPNEAQDLLKNLEQVKLLHLSLTYSDSAIYIYIY